MQERASGVLLHPTSLPGRWSIGDLGPAAYRFLDWLTSAGQSIWQVLPLGPTGWGDSPYAAASSFAGNPLLISPEALVAEDLLPASAVTESRTGPTGTVDFGAATVFKEDLLRRSWDHVRGSSNSDLLAELEEFERAVETRRWLADWALFAALEREIGHRRWSAWPAGLRQLEGQAVREARERLREEIRFQVYLQFLFRRQWQDLHAHARALGIEIVGDLPIYVALESADVWADQRLFDLDEEGEARAVAGVPPDYFAETGQLWGNPLYRWDRLRAENFGWWVERIAAGFRYVDRLRLDHFRAFVRYWRVPAEAETAAEGEWVEGPGADLFVAIEQALGKVPLIAEDLGVITDDVVALKQRFQLPGMKVLQFGFGEADSDHLPHRHTPEDVVYTGTHDNDTTEGWFRTLPAPERQRVLDYVGGTAADVSWSMIRAAMTSVAGLAVIPLQDLLELGSEARMNTPGLATGNWSWRFDPERLDAALAARLRRLTLLSGRGRDG